MKYYSYFPLVEELVNDGIITQQFADSAPCVVTAVSDDMSQISHPRFQAISFNKGEKKMKFGTMSTNDSATTCSYFTADNGKIYAIFAVQWKVGLNHKMEDGPIKVGDTVGTLMITASSNFGGTASSVLTDELDSNNEIAAPISHGLNRPKPQFVRGTEEMASVELTTEQVANISNADNAALHAGKHFAVEITAILDPSRQQGAMIHGDSRNATAHAAGYALAKRYNY